MRLGGGGGLKREGGKPNFTPRKLWDRKGFSHANGGDGTIIV